MDKNKLLKQLYDCTIRMVQATYNLAELYSLTNEQDFLNWQDELNEFSVK